MGRAPTGNACTAPKLWARLTPWAGPRRTAWPSSSTEGIRGNNDVVDECFSCLEIKIHGPGDSPRCELTSSLPREALDQIYKAHGLDIAPG